MEKGKMARFEVRLLKGKEVTNKWIFGNKAEADSLMRLFDSVPVVKNQVKHELLVVSKG